MSMSRMKRDKRKTNRAKLKAVLEVKAKAEAEKLEQMPDQTLDDGESCTPVWSQR